MSLADYTSVQVIPIYVIVCLNAILGIVGAAANVVNIVVFCKQGFQTSVSINLLGLAIADFASLLSLTWQSLAFIVLMVHADLSYLPNDVIYLTAVVQRSTFIRIAWWIITFITFERCLCIALPLKIKQIITPTFTFCVLCVIVVIALAGMLPYILARRIGVISVQNTTVIGFYYAENGPYIENISSVYSIVVLFVSYNFNVMFTAVIVVKLNIDSKWRESSTASTTITQGITSRDKRVTKMVAAISSIYIVCSLASCVSTILVLSRVPGYSNRFTDTTFILVREVMAFLEGIHSSGNNIVYYLMSSRYKSTFQKLFARHDCKQTRLSKKLLDSRINWKIFIR